MKMKTLIIALVLIPGFIYAANATQAETIRPAKETVEAAKAADKFILVISQSHTGVATDVLANEHTSHFLNEHFVIEQQVNPDMQTLYLIYNQQQKLVHRVADEPYPYELAIKIKQALNPGTQYYTLLARFDNGDRSAALLENLIAGAKNAGDDKNASRLMQAYLDTQASPTTPKTIRLLAKYTKTSKDPGFSILMANIDAADEVLGTGKTAEKLVSIIFDEAFAPCVNKKNIDIVALTEKAKSSYPNDELAYLIEGMAIQLLEMREDWEGIKSALPTYLRTHGDHLSDAMQGYYSWLNERR